MAFFFEAKERLECHRFDLLTCGEHFHDYLEMFYLEKGSTIARVDAVDYPVQAGDVFLSFPNQIHAYQDQEECRGVLCIFSYRSFEDLSTLFRQNVPQQPVIAARDVPACIPELFHALADAMYREPPYRDAVIKGYLSVLLGTLLPLMPLNPTAMSSSDTVQSILSYCGSNYQQDLTLESVARELHISKYHISHLFSKKIRIGFNDFINMLRVQDACERLKQGTGITATSMQAGFSSIRSFNRVFLRQTGMTPLKYQKKYQQPALQKTKNGIDFSPSVMQYENCAVQTESSEKETEP